LQAEGDGDVGVQVAKRTERREDDPFLHESNFRLGRLNL
jgi:hypothetical protein